MNYRHSSQTVMFLGVPPPNLSRHVTVFSTRQAKNWYICNKSLCMLEQLVLNYRHRHRSLNFENRVGATIELWTIVCSPLKIRPPLNYGHSLSTLDNRVGNHTWTTNIVRSSLKIQWGTTGPWTTDIVCDFFSNQNWHGIGIFHSAPLIQPLICNN